MKIFTTALALSVFGLAAHANELDPVASLPSALVVRESADGQREVFKAQAVVTNDAQALQAAQALRTEDKISVKNGTELDQTSSQNSWCYWRNPYYSYGYYYGYYSSGYSYYYYPTYAYYGYGGYSYYYYYYRY